ncbi:MAG: hypothetical protein A2V93_06590 [Ignavibacteria bacterium RBG_16_34_14]|nr:MAG: hypothetical protein A2V93_06590 [Ignavibacteria bacterium RBG_16_34_14]
MTYRITLIPGDGIGREITKATTKVLEHSGIKIDWEVVAKVIAEGKKVTKDINAQNYVSTDQFADAVIMELDKLS